MRDLVGGKIAGPDFARAWLAARRRALDAGERLRERFDRVLTDVFYSLDGYAIDPTLRDPDDVTDEELVTEVRMALDHLDSLDLSRRHRGWSEGA
ncbi:hypothetical protein ACLQ3B_20565 [Micromonospora sp. DT53]|uniref:hypothetical protein n=1 Tax=Micromonospora sp. DT53 TaxID=3393444 RepID=UPI003CEF62F0